MERCRETGLLSSLITRSVLVHNSIAKETKRCRLDLFICITVNKYCFKHYSKSVKQYRSALTHYCRVQYIELSSSRVYKDLTTRGAITKKLIMNESYHQVDNSFLYGIMLMKHVTLHT